jgi:hypothetical protein
VVVVLMLTTFAGASETTMLTFLHQVPAYGLAADDGAVIEGPAEDTDQPTKKAVKTFLLELLEEMISSIGNGKGVPKEQAKMVNMVEVTGMRQPEAVDEIAKAGLGLTKVKHDFSSSDRPGIVIGQDPPAGTELEADSEVTVVVAKTIVAVQPYGIETDPITGEPVRWRHMIVHRPFDVQLEEVVQNVPLFVISNAGLHHPPGEKDYDPVEVRAKCIAQRLEIAWNILNRGGHLEIGEDRSYDMPDDLLGYRLTGPFAPEYTGKVGDAPKMQPAIFVREGEESTPLRIVTIYPEDAKDFVSTQDVTDTGSKTFTPFDQMGLAEYLKALIEAHHLLFFKMSDRIEDYSSLDVCKTREGKIFKEIYLRAREVSLERGGVQDALERVAMDQRYRLERLARKAPMDWRFRDSDR